MSLNAAVFTEHGSAVFRPLDGVLRQAGWEAIETHAEGELLDRVKRSAPDLVVIGPTAGYNRSGVALTQAVRSCDRRCAVLLFTTCSSEEFVLAALRAGATDVLLDTASAGEIAQAVERVAGRRPPESAPPGRLVTGSRMVGMSQPTQQVREAIARAARSDSNVLITGETGTGKELVAELIHRNSVRASGPMVCINCAAIPDTLLESELFGFERGAFTGALSPTQGKLEQAGGGTVFFDEIGDMSGYAQAKILRAIESREIYRLSGRRPIRLDVRIIAATHHDLDHLARDGGFRRDLYFRINVARVHLASLRERRSDIPPLIEHYIREFNRTFRADVRGLEPDTLDRLLAYDWPGNVRELRNVIESVFVGGPAERISFVDLPQWLRRGMSESTTAPDEPERIIAALAATNWNKTRAAEHLRWSRMTLYRKIAKYRIASAV